MRSGMAQEHRDWLEVLGYPPQGVAPFSPEPCADPQPKGRRALPEMVQLRLPDMDAPRENQAL